MNKWPLLKRDWIGLRVKLLQTLYTNGGKTFRMGRVMIVRKYYRGLSLVPLKKGGGGITRVSPNSVALLPLPVAGKGGTP